MNFCFRSALDMIKNVDVLDSVDYHIDVDNTSTCG